MVSTVFSQTNTHDLALVNLKINEAMLVDKTPFSVSITIKNMGTATINADEYEIRLSEAHLGSGSDFDIITINAGADGVVGFVDIAHDSQTTITVIVPAHTFQTIVSARDTRGIYANVNFTTASTLTDANPSDNTSQILMTFVYMTGSQILTIAPSENNRKTEDFPLNFNWHNSISQSIYLKAQIGFTGGVITHLALSFTGAGNIPTNIPVSFWLANVPESKTSFISSNDWIRMDQFINIWNAKPIPDLNVAGENFIVIPFDNSFHYTGGNIVLMSQRHLTNQHYGEANTWTVHTQGANRTITIFNDNVPLDPNNPPTGARLAGFPHIRFAFAPSIRVEGTISLSTGSITGDGITITQVGTSRSVTTCLAGTYIFDNLPMTNQGLLATYRGYIDATSGSISTFTTNPDGTLSHQWNTTLENLPTFEITGTVILNTTGGVAEGVKVEISGYITDETFTDNEGKFRFAPIFDENSYTLTFTHPGFEPLERVVSLTGSQPDALSITLNEILYHPFGLYVENSEGSINLRWFNPTYDHVNFSHTGTNNGDPIGSNAPAHYFVAHRYTVDQIAELDVAGLNLYKVDFMPHLANSTYRVRIYMTAPGTMNPPLNPPVYIQTATNVIAGQRNAVLLDNELTIPSDRDLWIVIEIQTFEAGLSIGTDNGPAKHLFGNMMRIDESGWKTAYDIVVSNSDFNWQIWAFAAEGERDDFLQNSVAIVPDYEVLDEQFVYKRTTNMASSFFSGTTTDVIDTMHHEIHPTFTDPTRPFNNKYDVRRSITTNVNHASAVDVITDFSSSSRIMTIWDETGTLVPGTDYFYFVRARYTNHFGEAHSEWQISPRIRFMPTSSVTIEARIGGSGSPAVGASIRLGASTLTANSQGRVTFTNIRLGVEHDLTISLSGYVTVIEKVTFENSGPHIFHLYTLNTIFSENFESGQLPENWINIGLSNQNYRWVFGDEGFDGRGGGLAVASESWCMITDFALTPDNWLITRTVSIPASFTTRIEYWVATQDPDWYRERIFVYIFDANMTHPSEILGSGADTQLLLDHTVPASDGRDWRHFSHDITNRWAGRNVRFAFRHAHSTDQFAIKVDDIAVFNSSEGYATVRGLFLSSAQNTISGVNITLTEEIPMGEDREPYVFTGRSIADGSFAIAVKNNSKYILTAEYYDHIVISGPIVVDVRDYDENLEDPIYINIVSEYEHMEPVMATILCGNFPNPFNPTTTIAFDMASDGHVLIEIYNIRGQKVYTLINDFIGSGSHRLDWMGIDDNGRPVASGIYFYRMQTENYSATRKMIMMK
jgi:hypothetical protein